nr:MAG TPA: Restriction endonuclease [Caudoviricetes sp.]
METERSYTKSPIYKRWWYIVLIFISVLCSFINSIKPALFIFFSIVDCLLIVPILKNVYTKRKLKNKSISAFDIALAFAIIAIYTFVSAIVIAASYIGDDYYANADSIGTTYLMISAGAILISIACAIGGSVSAISRDGIRIFTSPLTYTTESINAELSPSPTAQNTTAAGTDTVKQPPVIPDRFASLVLSKIPFAYTAKASSNVPESTPKRTPAAEKVPEANIHTTKQLSKEPHAQISNEQSDLDMIRKMERDFQKSYKTAFSRLYNRDDCRRTFDALKKKYSDPSLPLAVHVRYRQLCEEYAPKFASPNPMGKVDHMDGHRFEKYCATVLQKNGFINVSVTPGSGDQGVDVIAEKEGVRYAVQCKCYSSALGNTPVQEVCAGKSMYNCHVGVVMTNNYFTAGAKQLAEKNGILLWDRDKLQQMIDSAISEESAV